MNTTVPKPWGTLKTRKDWETFYRYHLARDDKLLLHAILKIDDYQTFEEKVAGASIEHNGCGWNQYDSRIMSNMAEELRAAGRLPDDAVRRARTIVPKYWEQLMWTGKLKQQQFVERQQEFEAQMAAVLQLATSADQASPEQANQDVQLRLCLETGKPCDYGICDECQLAHHYQDEDER